MEVSHLLNRVAIGHYGDCDFIGEGIHELRIHFGPGYRSQDVKKAKQYWAEFKERHYD